MLSNLGNTGAVAAFGDNVGALLQKGQRVSDGDPAFTSRQQGMVVFGIADAHHVVKRDAEFVQRHLESSSLVHAGGKHHYCALIENHLQLKPQVVNGLEHSFLLRLPGGYDAAPRGKGHVALAEKIKKFLPRRLAQ